MPPKDCRRDKRVRLDQLLVERGLCDSRARAAALILAGEVVVGENRVDKPGAKVDTNATLRLKQADHPFVSRGGLKLQGALDAFGIAVAGLVILDVGASTGGFTDCLLSRGAARSYALDVGRAQLHERLRKDPRVVSLEGFNVRNLNPGDLPEKVDLAVFDLSFISLKLALPKVLACLKPAARLLLLVKPQFEVGKGQVGKGGIVRDETLRERAVDGIASFTQQLGLRLLGRVKASPPGADGNVETFLLLQAPGVPQPS